MRACLCGALMLLCGMVERIDAVQYADLSGAARAVVPERKIAHMVLTSGKSADVEVLEENATQVKVRILRSGSGIAMTKFIPRASIASIKPADVTGLFAEVLLARELPVQLSVERKFYEETVALCDEFLEKCGKTSQAEQVRALRDAFAADLAQLRLGMQKVNGQWWLPLRAAIERFKWYGVQIDAVKKRQDFAQNTKAQEEHERLLSCRREEIRKLPEIMRDRIPILLEDERFQDAAAETVAFLQFWINTVAGAEGSAADMLKQMDFDYFVRMQDNIMGAWRRSKDGRAQLSASPEGDMVRIPGGLMLMGRPGDDIKRDDFPVHLVFVPPFLIDKYEVTNREYQEFVDYVKKTGDASMEHPDAPPLKKHDAEGWQHKDLSGPDQPVVGIDWFDAYAFAKWKGKRLPSEAEWEYAARGNDGRGFPWGDNPGPDRVSINTDPGRRFLAEEMDRQNPPQPVEQPGGCACMKEEPPPPPPTQLPSRTWAVKQLLPPEALAAVENGKLDWDKEFVSPFGVFHMSGNASEWVADVYQATFYAETPVLAPVCTNAPDEGVVSRLCRGGSYLSTTPDEFAAFTRVMVNGGSVRGLGKRPHTGLRCARSFPDAAK